MRDDTSAFLSPLHLRLVPLLLLSPLASCLVPSLWGCGSDFDPPSVIERLRFAGLKVDRPEICPFGPACPERAFVPSIDVAVLAIDPQGIVADGRHPDGPYLRDGHSLTWSLCTFAFLGAEQKSPDCTAVPEMLLDLSGPLGNLSAMEVAGAALKTFESSGMMEDGGETQPSTTADPYEVLEYTQNVGVAISSAAEREWGLKGVVLSNRPAAEQNQNPVLSEVTIGDVPLTYGKPSAEVETGYAYRIGWTIPDESLQWYTIKSAEGPVQRRERLNLTFYANVGSFSTGGHIDLWLEDEEHNELFWRPPLEVPAGGQDATLVFAIYDWRGGVDWLWATVRVVRGSGASPR
ncbi:MAG: hypothetical protein HY897_02970 [Deltaproteobacteria bacterium]|nr:hypothetical protein [Deltaproteobacteria bacterium]